MKKDGFFQKEVKYAIDAYEEKSHATIEKIIEISISNPFCEFIHSFWTPSLESFFY